MNTKILGRYRGGKEKLAEKIVALFPKEATTYVEPFGGGMSVLLHTSGMFRQRIYNDINDDLVVMWRMIRDRPEELAAKIWATPYARAEMQACYPPSAAEDDLERARRMIVMGNMSMAPTRTKPDNTFAVDKTGAVGRKWLQMPETIQYVAGLIHDICIEHTSAETLFPRYDSPETVWYFDPPYTLHQRVKGKEYEVELSDLDHFTLGQMLHTLEGSVFLSGYQSELYNTLYKDFTETSFTHHDLRHAKRKEMLWYRYSPSILRQQCMAL